MKYGYVRETNYESTLTRQIEAVQEYGVDEIYEEWPGKRRYRRSQLSDMLGKLRAGDSLVVWRLDRLGKTSKQMIVFAEDFHARGIHFVSIKEKIDTSFEQGQHFIKMMCELGRMEREIIGERTRVGKQQAIMAGKTAGRKPVSKELSEMATKMYFSNQSTIEEIIQATGLSKSSIYNYIRKVTRSVQGE